MKIDKIIAQAAATSGLGKMVIYLLIASMATNCLLALKFLVSDNSIRQTLVPPEIHKSFWVDDQNVSQEYLEQMGNYVVGLFATFTPSSIDYNNAMLLKWTHPTAYGPLEVKFRAAASKAKAEGLSRYFAPREIQVDPKTRTVVIIGLLESFLANQKLPPDTKAYLVGFDYTGGRTSIREIRETSIDHPFDPVKPLPGR